MRRLVPAALLAVSCLCASSARAEDAPAPEAPPAPATPPAVVPSSPTPPAAATPVPDPAAPTAATSDPDALHVDDPRRTQSLVPSPVRSRPGRVTFDIDPVIDGSIVAVTLGFAVLLDLVNSTGEVRPQQISPTFQRSDLLAIDRIAVTHRIHESARTTSNIGLFGVAGYALLDTVLDGVRERSVQTSIADLFMYGESAAMAYGVTNLAKIAVRRPRPIAYVEFEANRNDPTYSNADTDSALSFFSGHAAVTSALGATATYLAFARSPRSARPWLTLAGAIGVSTLVAIERVRSGAHFPTDVIAGTIAGAGIGVVVPHLHRSEDITQRRVWVGFTGAPRGAGGTLDIGGLL